MTSLLKNLKEINEPFERKITSIVEEEFKKSNLKYESVQVTINKGHLITIRTMSLFIYIDVDSKIEFETRSVLFKNIYTSFELIECIANIVKRLKEEN